MKKPIKEKIEKEFSCNYEAENGFECLEGAKWSICYTNKTGTPVQFLACNKHVGHLLNPSALNTVVRF